MSSSFKTPFVVVLLSTAFSSAGVWADDAEFMAIYECYANKYRPLAAELERASWAARTLGTDEAFEKKKLARLQVQKLHADAAMFDQLVEQRNSRTITEPLAARLARIMNDRFLPMQADPKAVEQIIELETFFEHTLRNYTITVGGERMATTQVRQFLRTTTDSKKAETLWTAYMKLGKTLAPKLRELVRLRNRIAERIEQPHYYRLYLHLDGFNSTTFYRLFNYLNRDMQSSYASAKAEIDIAVAAKFGIRVSELRPWHFGDLFFRSEPVTTESDLDAVYANVDLTKLARTYLEGIGLPCGDILGRSQLSTKPNSTYFPCYIGTDEGSHARIACNLEQTVLGAENLLQALTRAVYRDSIGKDVPFLLQTPPHRIVEEGVASLVGATVRSKDFLSSVLKLNADDMQETARIAENNVIWRALVRAQWVQLVARFEVSMYGNPSRDLPEVWSEFTAKYQSIALEEEYRYGFALVPEIIFRPGSHYSVLMGDVLAEQIRNYVTVDLLKKDETTQPLSFHGERNLGAFLRKSIMAPGNTHVWEKLLIQSLGEAYDERFYLSQLFGAESTRPDDDSMKVSRPEKR